MTTGQRILFNALATYGRTMLAIFLGLFSSRWILAALGEVDYGLMGVVGGILVFITFLNTLSSSATSRFFAFSIGQNDVEETRRWFNTALSFEAIVPVSLVIIGYFAGDYAIDNFLSIPPDRLITSKWVFRLSLITALTTMCCSPFMAMYTAKQNIAEASLWGMGISLTSFAFAYTLTRLDGDHWFIFSAGTTLIVCTFTISQAIRAYRKFAECKIVFAYWFNKQRLKEMTAYSCWTLFGGLGGIFYTSGIGIVLNKFFPPLLFPSVNASYSVGATITNHTGNISNALMGAFMPEIVSSEGRGDRASVIRQMYRAARLSYIIISIVAIPILFEADFILKAWLGNPPEYAALFCRTLLIGFLISRIIGGFDAAICATGKIRNYQIINSSFAYLTVAVSALALFLNAGLWGVCLILIGYNLANVMGNVYFCRKLVGIRVRDWLNNVVRPVVIALSVNIAFGILLLFITRQFSPVLQFFLVSAALVGSAALTSWKFLIINSEKNQFKILFQRMIKKSRKLFSRRNISPINNAD